ncbi:MAG: hypothetical protein HY785_03640 [Oscillatoriophycideae cyanobacterium NC_groundwater_1537_Pr4_S-0.65um_50_18]|nr:hypothetical protein [Oscillatoriophycideae cyanobacterium NC_groundwater_1537_Pr4_S-0.65um_50_18]
MTDDKEQAKNRFLYPRSSYHGEFTPEKLTFNANLQEFAQRVSLLCGLETGGQISTEEAYLQIKEMWKQLKRSKKELLDVSKPEPPELPPE